MKVLLTGSNGFVGSHIAEHLLKRGHQVACIVRATSDRKWLTGLNAEYRVCDVTGIATSPGSVRDIDAIVHAAGVVRAVDKETYYTINQKATGDLAETVLRHNPGLKKFIYLSSQAAMGPSERPGPKLLTERETPVSDYGKSKLAGEKELRILDGKIPYTILRPASVYGPRDKDIFIFFQLVYRGFCPRPWRERLIQLLFVGDLAEAAVRAIEMPATDYQTYFLADDTPYSWQAMGKEIAGTIGRRTLPLPLPDFAFHAASRFAEAVAALRKQPAVLNRQKTVEMMQSYWLGDTMPARKDLCMDFTKLKIGAKITYQWYRENGWL